jgi:chromate transport protein ChrA
MKIASLVNIVISIISSVMMIIFIYKKVIDEVYVPNIIMHLLLAIIIVSMILDLFFDSKKKHLKFVDYIKCVLKLGCFICIYFVFFVPEYMMTLSLFAGSLATASNCFPSKKKDEEGEEAS